MIGILPVASPGDSKGSLPVSGSHQPPSSPLPPNITPSSAPLPSADSESLGDEWIERHANLLSKHIHYWRREGINDGARA